jgi:tetratricopeptide (TPR) repeat protein
LAAYEEAIKLSPNEYFALKGLAWLLATCPDARLRDGRPAVKLATRAFELIYRLDKACVDTMAAAHAEVGNFEAAVELEREAIGMLPDGAPNLEHYRVWMDAYEAKKPHREAIKKGG